MAYSDQQKYSKFNVKKSCGESCGESCGCENTDTNCGCCPIGLVAVYDDNNNQISCLTPADAELYTKNAITCPDGYVKLFRNSNSEFLGCVPSGEFAALYSQVNPV